jgi:hypothetical protein
MANAAQGMLTAGGAKKRAPGMMIGITYGAFVAASVLGYVLTMLLDSIGSLLGSLLYFGALVFFWVVMRKMIGELREYLGSGEPPGWTFILPFVKVPDAVGAAKQKAGCSNASPKPIWMYIFAAPFALQSDLNEVWEKTGG